MFVCINFICCGGKNGTQKKLTIYADIFPVYDFTRQIVGSKAEVKMLIPSGADPHHFEVPAKDIFNLNKADIFLYCSTGRNKIREIAKSLSKKVLTVDVCSNTQTVETDKTGEIIQTRRHKHFHLTGVDSHVWLDFDNAVKMTENIYGAFAEKNIPGKAYYKKNAHRLQKKINEIKISYDKVLNTCQNKTIVHLGHFAFGYIAHRYKLKYITLQGISAGSEPSAKEVFELIGFINENKIEYIFTDIFLNPRFARVISQETGALLLKLNPMGNITADQLHKNYGKIAIENLNNLKKGLKCIK